MKFRLTQGKKSEVCKFCGKVIRHYESNLYHSEESVFPQYCPNIVDKSGKVVEYGVLHAPIK